MVKAVLRIYAKEKDKLEDSKTDKTNILDNNGRVFVFDAETTADQYQNLKFGSFRIYLNEILYLQGIFVNENCLSENELRIIENYCNKNHIELYYMKDFIDNIFYPEVYELRALCMGFNLPFDLTRLANHFGHTRRNNLNGFSLKISNKVEFPRIKISHKDRNKNFIQFASRGIKGIKYFKGNFLDVMTLATALTDEKSISLKKAGEMFNTEHRKAEAEQHGIVNEKYIEYNLNDVLVTYEVYQKILERLKNYPVDKPITKIYSSASLGKACLSKMGIKPFSELNKDFPAELLGKAMSAYYGGRAEVKIREEPVKITLLDFTSMYPTLGLLMNIWDLITAEKITYSDCTQEIQELLNNKTLDDLTDKELWKKMNVLVELKPNDDILPLRMQYDEKSNAYNIGINYVTSEKSMYYFLPDIIASKILNGKIPKIISAIRFDPKGKQSGLKEVELFGMKLNSNQDNFFKKLVEERQRIKSELKNMNGEDKIILEYKEKGIKVIVNATSYGIFIELNPEDKEAELDINSNIQFKTMGVIENPGNYFNPIIGVLLTSGARLMLAMSEAFLARKNKVHAFCDTDSMGVPPEIADELQEFFEPLSPYENIQLFKKEKINVWFYGISAKRYVIYDKKGDDIEIIDKSLHGLGHILNPFKKESERIDWQERIWLDILKFHYGLVDQKYIQEKYGSLYELVQLTVTSYDLLKRFKKINGRKPIEKRIKPFNFFIIGISNKRYKNKKIKPMVPFTDDSQSVVYGDFTDYISGKVHNGIEYWMSLYETIFKYINHKESKFDGNKGILKRKHLVVDDFIYIGKESNDLDNSELEGIDYHTYNNNEDLKEKILGLKPKKAKKMGIPERTLKDLKRRIKEGKEFKIKNKTRMRLMKNII